VALTRDQVLGAAVALADAEGLSAVTMRRLAGALGVEAMSLYHHVRGKEALLDGAVEVVMAEVAAAIDDLGIPEPTQDWQGDLRATILASREVLLRHPWVPGLLETRASLSPTVVAHHEHVLRLMHEGGFGYDLAHHALHALGSRALGFSQELFQPAPDGEEQVDLDPADFPHLGAMVAEVAHTVDDPTLGWCDDQTEFEFSLDLLLDGLERLRSA